MFRRTSSTTAHNAGVAAGRSSVPTIDPIRAHDSTDNALLSASFASALR